MTWEIRDRLALSDVARNTALVAATHATAARGPVLGETTAVAHKAAKQTASFSLASGGGGIGCTFADPRGPGAAAPGEIGTIPSRPRGAVVRRGSDARCLACMVVIKANGCVSTHWQEVCGCVVLGGWALLCVCVCVCVWVGECVHVVSLTIAWAGSPRSRRPSCFSRSRTLNPAHEKPDRAIAPSVQLADPPGRRHCCANAAPRHARAKTKRSATGVMQQSE
jgi:hypothetical protein